MAEREFDTSTVKEFPKSTKKVQIEVAKYSIRSDEEPQGKATTVKLSPYGIEFHGTQNFEEGTLLKIHLTIPDYWTRKRKFVSYSRVDSPSSMKVLGKVVHNETLGRRGRKRVTMVEMVNIDEVDEKVLRSYLEEGAE